MIERRNSSFVWRYVEIELRIISVALTSKATFMGNTRLSEVYRMNRRGPRTDPCGTPCGSGQTVAVIPSKRTLLVLSLK